MKLNKIHHVAVIVSDYEKSKDFYVNQLEFEIIRENYRAKRDDWKLDLRLGDCELEIFGVKNPPARVNRPEACGLRHLAFTVENMEEAVAWLSAKGIETEPVRIDDFTGKKIVLFATSGGSGFGKTVDGLKASVSSGVEIKEGYLVRSSSDVDKMKKLLESL